MSSIRIFYQPIVRLGDLKPDYVEILARAATRDGGLAGPEAILEAMDSSENSMVLTASIMRRALAEYSSTRCSSRSVLPVAAAGITAAASA